ncbi:MAG: ATP-binding cassette domain-containing protein [Eubacteriales bacterium]
MKHEVLRIENLSYEKNHKSYLKQVNFHLYQEEFLGICGLHNSGKTTLANIISGLSQATEGRLYLQEKSVDLFNSTIYGRNNQRLGIFKISMTPNFVPVLSISENLFALRPKINFIFNANTAAAKTVAILEQIKINVSPNTLISDLSVSQTHLLEIAKCISMGAKIIILDDIAKNYTVAECMHMVWLIKNNRQVTFIYISSKDDPILRETERIIIMRGGMVAGTMYHEDYSADHLMSMCAGYGSSSHSFRKSTVREEVVLDASIPSNYNRPIQFTVHAGEVFGIFDLEGGSRWEIINSFLFASDSTLIVAGHKANNYREAVKYGMALLKENYSKNDLLPCFDFYDNLLFQALPKISRWGVIQKNLYDFVSEQLSVHFSADDIQQRSQWGFTKTMLYRWIATNPKIMILNDLTSGNSPAIKEEFDTIIDQTARNGSGILLISTDFSECQRLCDRILIVTRTSSRIFEKSENSINNYVQFLYSNL